MTDTVNTIAPIRVDGTWLNAYGPTPVSFTPAGAAIMAPLLLEDGETFEIRPHTDRPGERRAVAYGVRDGRYRRLPISVMLPRPA
jgi:hypothetical protein